MIDPKEIITQALLKAQSDGFHRAATPILQVRLEMALCVNELAVAVNKELENYQRKYFAPKS